MPLVASRPTDSALASLLERHPEVRLSDSVSQPDRLEFDQGTWHRTLRIGGSPAGEAGLIELMDNNPLVCADLATVPGPLDTLALIALGPLARAGLILEEPALQTNAPGTYAPSWIRAMGWDRGLLVMPEERDLGSVLAAQAMAVIATPEDESDLDSLYEEAYGRSFYVRREESAEWHASLVAGRPWAAYRLRLTPDEPRCLLTVQVMADRDGKCGAAQAVHALNVMAGCEECLGIPERLDDP